MEVLPLHLGSDRSDSFVIDMDGFMIQSTSPAKKDIPISVSSVAKLQRNLSRKGSQRFSGRERTVNGDQVPGGGESTAMTPSPRGPTSQENGAATAAAATDSPVTSGSGYPRKNISLKRYSAWAVEPKRVLLFFATLSSFGTMLLIYFTISMNKIAILDNVPEWNLAR